MVISLLLFGVSYLLITDWLLKIRLPDFKSVNVKDLPSKS